MADGKEPTKEAIKECREYAGQQMDAAKENELYICGMQPLDPDNPMHGVIIARNGLECHDHVEFEYFSQPYQNAAWYNAKLCAYCAGTSGLDGFVDEELAVEWRSLLPVCQTCRDDGALPLVRTRKRNGSARARQAQTARLTEVVSTQRALLEPAAAETSPAAPPTATSNGDASAAPQSRRVERRVLRRSNRAAGAATSSQPAG